MKKLVLTTLLSFSLSLVALAQHHHGEMKSPEEHASKMTEKMTEKLSLTPEQKESVYKINLEMAKERKEAQEDRAASRDKHMAQMKEVLTEEQYARLQEMHQKKMHDKKIHPRRDMKERNREMIPDDKLKKKDD